MRFSAVLKSLVILGAIQGLIVLFLFVFPDLNQLVKHVWLRFEETDTVVLLNYRCFGLTSFYTFGMPLFLGFLGSIDLHLSITHRKHT